MMDESRSFLLELSKLSSSSLSLYQFINSIFAETELFSDPLFASAIAFCTLVFLYLPHFFWRFSPVLILSWILLISILRLGAIQNFLHEQDEHRGSCSDETLLANDDLENRASSNGEEQRSTSSIEIEPNKTESVEQVQKWISSQMGFEPSSCFLEWNVKAPLEVIYEEGEEQEAENSSNGEWDSPRSIDLFCLDDEEEREALIEIALDGCKKKKREMEFHLEEENLIEIDISLMRYRELSGEDEVLSGEISCH